MFSTRYAGSHKTLYYPETLEIHVPQSKIIRRPKAKRLDPHSTADLKQNNCRVVHGLLFTTPMERMIVSSSFSGLQHQIM